MKVDWRTTLGVLGFSGAINLLGTFGVQAGGPPTPIRVEIEINSSPQLTDDYLTWAPTRARIRFAGAPTGTSPSIVVLTNDAERPVPEGRDQPLDGNVAFAERLSSGETATLQTLALTLPPDGSWVPFFVAGSFPRASTADKDAVIEAHLGDAAGPLIGSHAMMVRVRKNVDKLTLGERDAFLKALHDLHVEANSYETFPHMHDLAAKGKLQYQPVSLPDGTLNPKYWPDQAHEGSAFFPWHRAFLLLLERRLQSINPAVTIPYWRQNDETGAFNAQFLGTNKRRFEVFQTEVIFSPANWLYGWNISYNDLKTVIRAPRDMVQLKIGTRALVGDTDLFGATPLHPQYAQFHTQLEINPHNTGHFLLGAWHANCLISPGDPSFWVFHAEHDRLWAKWQWFHGRFDAEGLTRDSYDFPGVFVPNDARPDETRSTDLGHNLKDTMWPWDGTKGRVIEDGKSRANHPDENPFPAFPVSPVVGLWPASNGKPMPADMIDYLGLSPSRLPHGFAYDDVPYGTRPQPGPSPAPDLSLPVARVLADTAQDNRSPPGRRQLALSALRAAGHPRPDTIFHAVAADISAPPEVRREAAVNLIEFHPAAGIAAVFSLLDQGRDEEAFTAAILETASFVHHGKLPADVAAKMHHLLTRIATNVNDPRAARAAITLAAMVDVNAPKHLISLLKSEHVGDATRAELVAALPLNAMGVIPTLRELLEKALRDNDTETALAIIRALAGDPDSRAFRLRLVDDANAGALINRGAMRSLMRETKDVIPKLLMYIEGPLPATDERKLEAAGAFRVAAEALRPFPAAAVADWRTKIQTVRGGLPATATELKIALSIVLDVLDLAN